MIKTFKLSLQGKIKSNLKIIKLDPKDKTAKEKHFSVGAVIKKNNKYLMIKRNLYPPGYAGIAGHVNKNETFSQALKREVKEETNYDLVHKKLVFNEIIKGYKCRTGFSSHEWRLYECSCKGKLKLLKDEEKSIGYKTKEQINKLYHQGKLEPVWEYWFKKLKVIKNG